MNKKILFCTSVILILFISYFLLKRISRPRLVGSLGSKESQDPNKPRVLLTCLANGLGGGEIHMLTFHAMLKKNGYFAPLLVPANSPLDHYLTEHNEPHYTTCINKLSCIRPLYYLLLGWYMQALCKQENITIIQCNNRPEVTPALETKKHLPVHVAFTRHVPDAFALEKIKEVDAIIGVSPYITPYLEAENRKLNLGIRHISHIPPFFDADNFLNYQPTETKEVFFKENFWISLKPYPVITMMANFHSNLMTKNHLLMLQAINILIRKKNKPLTLMLAGNGPSQNYIQNKAKELGLEPYVHFLGFTYKTAGLLYHSDIFVLSSSKEASPLVYREAGLMKKPAIGATETGATAIITHEKTGLIFKNNDAQDLADQIEKLIDNPTWAQELGNNAYSHIMQNFSPDASFAMYDKMYQELQALDQQ